MHMKCVLEECDTKQAARGLCAKHYYAAKDAGTLERYPTRSKFKNRKCTVEGCDRKHAGHGFCEAHLVRHRKGDLKPGVPLTKEKGGTIHNGYRILYRPGHREASKTGFVLEHRMVMSDHLGRKLFPHENVHHIGGDRLDNRIERLELWSTKQPCGQRIADKVAWAREILSIYGPTTPDEERYW